MAAVLMPGGHRPLPCMRSGPAAARQSQIARAPPWCGAPVLLALMGTVLTKVVKLCRGGGGQGAAGGEGGETQAQSYTPTPTKPPHSHQPTA